MKKYIFMSLLVTALCLTLTCARAAVRDDGPTDLIDWTVRSVHVSHVLPYLCPYSGRVILGS